MHRAAGVFLHYVAIILLALPGCQPSSVPFYRVWILAFAGMTGCYECPARQSPGDRTHCGITARDTKRRCSLPPLDQFRLRENLVRQADVEVERQSRFERQFDRRLVSLFVYG